MNPGEPEIEVPRNDDGSVNVRALSVLVRRLIKQKGGLRLLRDRLLSDMVENYLIESEEGKSTKLEPQQSRLSRKQTQGFAELLLGQIQQLESEED